MWKNGTFTPVVVLPTDICRKYKAHKKPNNLGEYATEREAWIAVMAMKKHLHSGYYKKKNIKEVLVGAYYDKSNNKYRAYVRQSDGVRKYLRAHNLEKSALDEANDFKSNL